MMNVAPLRAAIDAAPGDGIVVAKGQLHVMLDEIERGYAAERDLVAAENALVNVRTIVNFTPKRWAVST